MMTMTMTVIIAFFSLISRLKINLRSKVSTSNKHYRRRNLQFLDPKTVEMKEKELITPEETPDEETIPTPIHQIPYLKKEIEEGGRLGNMMFQWAAIMGIARLNNLQPCHVPGTGNYWHEMLDAFEREFQECPDGDNVAYRWSDSQLDPLQVLRDPNDDRDVGIVEPTYLEKYRYFRDIPHEVFQAFKLRENHINAANEYLHPFIDSNPDIIKIGIHVRRGDLQNLHDLTFLKPSQFLVSPSYFENAMYFYRKRFGPNVRFFIASNTMSWCKEQEVFQNQPDVTFLPESSEYTPLTDFAILTTMDHLIISFGTFSWWAAFMGPSSRGGMVLYHDPVTINNDVLPSWLHIPDEPDMMAHYEIYEKYFGNNE